jgi:heterotetrameric sarcosine oxidase gamma subunit
VSAPESLSARSPLAAQSIPSQGWSGNGVVLSDRFGVSAAMVTLRPGRANTVSADANLTIMSCGPRRYLAISNRESPGALMSALQERFAGGAAIVDYSDQLAFISIAGPRSALVLSRLCSLDFDARVFKPLSAVVARMESVRAFLWRQEREEHFLVGVQRSLAAGAWESLVEACESIVTSP